MRLSTSERIVQESLALFNDKGERAMTTNHIANHLGISPGNLYYHFPNKEAIVYQIFLRYREDMRIQLKPNIAPQSPLHDLEHHLAGLFSAMWRYRFLFYDLPGLLARNPALQIGYQEFIDTDLRESIGNQFNGLMQLGLFRVPPEAIAALATNIWLVVKFWFAFQQSLNPKESITEAIGRRGILQVLALLKPYVTAPFTEAFTGLEAKYG
jgi:AcrR family transcriptional regulator